MTTYNRQPARQRGGGGAICGVGGGGLHRCHAVVPVYHAHAPGMGTGDGGRGTGVYDPGARAGLFSDPPDFGKKGNLRYPQADAVDFFFDLKEIYCQKH